MSRAKFGKIKKLLVRDKIKRSREKGYTCSFMKLVKETANGIKQMYNFYGIFLAKEARSSKMYILWIPIHIEISNTLNGTGRKDHITLIVTRHMCLRFQWLLKVKEDLG